MSRQHISKCPRFNELIVPIFLALKKMGGSGSNAEIRDTVAKDLHLSDEVLNEMLPSTTTQTLFENRLAWARTYLKSAGVITNSARSVWAIEPQYISVKTIDPGEIVKKARNNNRITSQDDTDSKGVTETVSPDLFPENFELESNEIRPWKQRLSEVLKKMDAFAFERLSQRLLRECGFTQVTVTKKSGDGGIDGNGKLIINGIVSFNVAFQCKRYAEAVGASAIRDFRGSLTTDIEKGIFITTGTFTKAAIDEASKPGKKQIDLINGEQFMDKLAEYGLGLKEFKDYEIDEVFFKNC